MQVCGSYTLLGGKKFLTRGNQGLPSPGYWSRTARSSPLSIRFQPLTAPRSLSCKYYLFHKNNISFMLFSGGISVALGYGILNN
jgi:hypothetical protein